PVKSRRWLSTVTREPSNVGRTPTLLAEWYQRPPTRVSVAYTPRPGSNSWSQARFSVDTTSRPPVPVPATTRPVSENGRPSSRAASSIRPSVTARRTLVLDTISPPTTTGGTISTE